MRRAPACLVRARWRCALAGFALNRAGVVVLTMVWAMVLAMVFVPARAQEAASVLELLQGIQSAARTQDYAGVFVHQVGEVLTSSRIVHVVDGTGERERLEKLDGEAREYLRHNDATQCLVPARRLVIRARGRNDRFPDLLAGDGAGVEQYYRLRAQGETARVAGRECRVVRLEPADDQRYGYTLCTDSQTGLLLKVQVAGNEGVLDQTAFTSVAMGGEVSPAQLDTGWDTRDWQVQEAPAPVVSAQTVETRGWRIVPPAGYRAMTQLNRAMPDRREVSQLVLSDGLAAISVFIEPLPQQQAREKMSGTTWRRGALSVHTARIGPYGLTLLGDVPPHVLQEMVQRMQFVPPSAAP